MHGRSPLAAAVLLLVSTMLAMAAPAGAATVLVWEFDQRPAGLPMSVEPAQTLSSGRASLAQGPESASLQATVELAGVPAAETSADLRLEIGTVEGGECRTDWQLVVPTLAPTGPASREGATISVALSTGPQEDLGSPRCGSVSLVGSDGVVLDRLEDADSGVIIADPGASSRIKQVVGTRVRPGHWSTLWVRVRHGGAEADGVRVSGGGRGVDVRSATARLTLHSGDEVWVPLRVRMRGDRARELTIRASPLGYLAFRFTARREVVLRPAR